jgi:DNA-binding transcriptional LysR family regulator
MLTSDDLVFFNAVATSDSLAAAARALDVSAPAVTQRLRLLENRLRARLVNRGGGNLALTSEGELLAERGRVIVNSMTELSESLAELRGEVTGHLRIVAPLGFGRRHIAPLVGEFQASHNSIEIDLILTDRLDRMPESAWDLAVHVGPMSTAAANLHVRQLAPNRRFVCGSPDYLARHGVPAVPGELRRHSCIALRENDEDVTLWRFRSIQTETVESVRIEPRLASNDGEVVKAWALAGRGLTVRSEWDVAADLRMGSLIRVLADHELPAAPVAALISSRREARSARTRHFLDALVGRFAAVNW